MEIAWVDAGAAGSSGTVSLKRFCCGRVFGRVRVGSGAAAAGAAGSVSISSGASGAGEVAASASLVATLRWMARPAAMCRCLRVAVLLVASCDCAVVLAVTCA